MSKKRKTYVKNALSQTEYLASSSSPRFMEGKLALRSMLVDELKMAKTPEIQELIGDIDKAIENKNSSV